MSKINTFGNHIHLPVLLTWGSEDEESTVKRGGAINAGPISPADGRISEKPRKAKPSSARLSSDCACEDEVSAVAHGSVLVPNTVAASAVGVDVKAMNAAEPRDWCAADVGHGEAGMPSCEAMSEPYGSTGPLSDQESKRGCGNGDEAVDEPGVSRSDAGTSCWCSYSSGSGCSSGESRCCCAEEEGWEGSLLLLPGSCSSLLLLLLLLLLQLRVGLDLGRLVVASISCSHLRPSAHLTEREPKEAEDLGEFGRILHPRDACLGLCLLPPPLGEAEGMGMAPEVVILSKEGLLVGRAGEDACSVKFPKTC